MEEKLTKWNLIWNDRKYACEIPASMYSVLYEHNVIDDPYAGKNHTALFALSQKDCAFETVFSADRELLKKEYIELRFEGLDTVCDIYLNGEMLGQADNMHRTWEFSVRTRLLCGENHLKVCFHSPVKAAERMQAEHELVGNSDSYPGFPHLRKAYYMFGWDWCPDLPDMGIWKPVSLVAYDHAVIRNVRIRQTHEADGSVCVSVMPEWSDPCPELTFSATLKSPEGRIMETVTSDGMARFRVTSPRLWYPNGLGEQPLYEIEVQLLYQGTLLDRVVKRIGLRTLTVMTRRDEIGKPFCFVVNGIGFFAMGANYIPEDNLLPRLSRKRTEDLIRSCVEANFNMLRVWGGGIYPSDDFFDLCDEYGILVWQDFMFSCATIRLTDSFRENVIAECREQIKRLRDHPSLGLLCGNNEMELAVSKWKRYCKNEDYKADYLELFEKIIPKICAETAPDTFYWPSSPSSGGRFDSVNEDPSGDRHFWNVWHSLDPIGKYRECTPRFMTEFGFESLPSMRTIESFTEPDQREFLSEYMEKHQKCKGGNSRILYYLVQEYPYPKTLRELSYLSQLLHADAIRTAVEHLRRNRDVCRGALYWQLNDCWPGITPSSIDYREERKAPYYAAKECYAPVILIADRIEKNVRFSVSNESLKEFSGSVEYRVRTNRFQILRQGSFPVFCRGLTCMEICSEDLSEPVAGREEEVFLEYRLLDSRKEELSHGSLLFVPSKYYRFEMPEFSWEAEQTENGWLLHVRSSCYAAKVFLEADGEVVNLFDKQFFDVTSPEGVTVRVKKNGEEELSGIRVLTVNQIGKADGEIVCKS